ncbi:MnmC family methyltransferase [Roseofilum sp. BLCC_M154]|uniref:MnmC family methyltransferase n=1 Tax=Roseofilum acuticapitatum BLCC-M154 TaxID=3022444 RepID=A0ABT7AW83_9CYAN|nr:MnmC family methyltransferase [Roseofilum acuticapitatum]MDJ1170303.1 MnmC family methyltransferase [Roseofilum acuticapitatum BLCC-M154]
MTQIPAFTPQPTGDGSWTFFSPEFGELFHSHHGAKQEANKKFVEPTRLVGQALKGEVGLLDICYGLGYNSASALEALWSANPRCEVSWVGLELDERVAEMAIAHNFHENWPHPINTILPQLASTGRATTPQFTGILHIGDARQTLASVIAQGFQADAIFLDPFSPPTCPQLWTVEFLGLVAQVLKPEGYLATYSCAASVRAALRLAGFEIGTTVPVGRKSPGTLARFCLDDLIPLSQKEEEHLQTRAAIPYRDPSLTDTAEVIGDRRQQEQQNSSLEPSSHWKKRWGAIAGNNK